MMLSSLILLAAGLIVSARDLSSHVADNDIGTDFSIRGCLTFPINENNTLFTIADRTGGATLKLLRACTNAPAFTPGDLVSVTGRIESNIAGSTLAVASQIVRIGNEPPPSPRTISFADIWSDDLEGIPVRILGTIQDCFIDEVDPRWTVFSLETDGGSLYAFQRTPADGTADPDKFIGATASLTGVRSSSGNGFRKMNWPRLLLAGPESVNIIRSPADPFCAPLVEGNRHLLPSDFLSKRRIRIRGRVKAVWGVNTALVRDDKGEFHRIDFRGGRRPGRNECVEAVGRPTTDLYGIHLTDAIWRPAPIGIRGTDTPPEDVRAADLISDSTGKTKINALLQGHSVRLTGTVQDILHLGDAQGCITLKSGPFSVPVDISACPVLPAGLSVGCTISAAGTCVVESETWSPSAPFPHTTGVRIVAQDRDDIRILSRPSWWTPRRLMTAIAVLVFALIAIFIWNRVLRRIIDRKSRQLLKEQVAQIKTALRVDERTHLAVELHDSLSQNLSGVACQIAATKGTLPDSTCETARYLETAERMLLSCRTELRRCLWDLRGDTLEEANFTEAIRKTLAPVAIGVETIIRFNVPRNRLSDSTAHAVLCIIRELAANAIRHGKAKTIRVAGEFHNGALSFSVRDDGCGFDPSRCNGPAEGHFGLEGIRERIKHLDGTFVLDSKPGKGSHAVVTLMSIQTEEDPTT